MVPVDIRKEPTQEPFLTRLSQRPPQPIQICLEKEPLEILDGGEDDWSLVLFENASVRRGVILDNDPGHIALVRRIIGANFWFSEPMVGFCPQMASAFGWRMSSDDPTRFISGSGTLQVRTLNWRDSGCVGRFHGETMLREGQLVVASPDAFAQLSSVVQIPQRVDGWRTIKKDGSVRSSPASSNAP